MYLFGPVPSRRLGRSLGVDIIPLKRCSFNCIYCQLGPTTELTSERVPYGSKEEFVQELVHWLENGGTANYITFAGSGEPTLNPLLGSMIEAAKKLTSIPIAVLTNGGLFWREDVRRDIIAADFVQPTLVSAFERTFLKIHRPARTITLEKHIEGLRIFREEKKSGIYALEVMIVKGINDTPEEIDALRELIYAIKPDFVDLNTPVRPPSSKDIQPVDFDTLCEIGRKLSYPHRVLTPHAKGFLPLKVTDSKLVEILSRHPDSLEGISIILGENIESVRSRLDKLVEERLLSKVEYSGRIYYKAAERSKSDRETGIRD